MTQLDFLLWLQSFRSPWLDAFFAAVTGTAEDNLITFIAAILIPLVALSRLYLGAHWPVDVVGGIAIGLALVGLALTLYRFWDRRPLLLPLWGQLALAVAVPLTLFVLYPKTSMQMGAALGMVTGFSQAAHRRAPLRGLPGPRGLMEAGGQGDDRAGANAVALRQHRPLRPANAPSQALPLGRPLPLHPLRVDRAMGYMCQTPFWPSAPWVFKMMFAPGEMRS